MHLWATLNFKFQNLLNVKFIIGYSTLTYLLHSLSDFIPAFCITMTCLFIAVVVTTAFENLWNTANGQAVHINIISPWLLIVIECCIYDKVIDDCNTYINMCISSYWSVCHLSKGLDLLEKTEQKRGSIPQ